MKSARLHATSVGVNQVAECVDWGPQGLIAYGAHNQAVLYDVQVKTIVHHLLACTWRRLARV